MKGRVVQSKNGAQWCVFKALCGTEVYVFSCLILWILTLSFVRGFFFLKENNAASKVWKSCIEFGDATNKSNKNNWYIPAEVTAITILSTKHRTFSLWYLLYPSQYYTCSPVPHDVLLHIKATLEERASIGQPIWQQADNVASDYNTWARVSLWLWRWTGCKGWSAWRWWLDKSSPALAGWGHEAGLEPED